MLLLVAIKVEVATDPDPLGISLHLSRTLPLVSHTLIKTNQTCIHPRTRSPCRVQECDEPRNDICQAADQPYCPGPQGYTPGQPGEHLDLALAAWQVIGNNPPVTGIIKILFRQ